MSILMGKGFPVDTDALRRSHLLITGVSGSGKSFRLRCLAEELAPVMPVWIFDVEGEYFTLREKFPFYLFGENGDAPLSVATAAVMARKMLELKCSAIFDLSALDTEEQHAWMRVFINALMAIPRESGLWTPLACLVDEAHLWAPEKGEGVSEALSAMKNLCARARKRGIFVVLATQRISKLANNCASEMQNYLVGRVTLTADQERAAKTLGVSGRKAERAAFYHEIKVLKDHNFYGQGIAISADRTLLQPIAAKTTHLRPGDLQDIKPPATPQEIKAFLPQLASLAADAKKLAGESAPASGSASSAELQALRGELARERAVGEERTAQFAIKVKELRGVMDQITALIQGGGQYQSDIKTVSPDKKPAGTLDITGADIVKGWAADRLQNATSSNGTAAIEPDPDARVNHAERAQNRLLHTLRMAEVAGISVGLHRTWLAILSHVSPTSSQFRRNLSAIEKAGMVYYPAEFMVALTDKGREAAGGTHYRGPQLVHAVLMEAVQKVFERREPPQYRILLALVEAKREWLSRDELAEASQQSPTSSAYRGHLSDLRSLGLIEIGSNSTVRVDPFIYLGVTK